MMQWHFSGHETFPLRYQWLTKCVQSVIETPDIFRREDAIVQLGVGKNMVRAIRFWGRACGVVEDGDTRGRSMAPTQLGLALFGKDGWDPYLEDPGTLWLFHWQICTNQELCSTCYLMFNKWISQDFTKERVLEWLSDLISKQGTARVTRNSLNRDIDVFIRTYTPTRMGQKSNFEDSLHCPLVELGLMREHSSGMFSFLRGQHSSLPDWVFAFALADFWHNHRSNQNTLSFDEIAYAEGSPGKAFKLDETSLAERLERLATLTGGSWNFDETAGIRQLYQANLLQPMELLENHYASSLQPFGRM